MARFAVSNVLTGAQTNLTTTAKTHVAATALTGATTLRRGWIDEVIVGADAAAVSTDCQIRWNWLVCTTAGTAGSTPVPNPDPSGSDAAALLTYGINHSAEPTYATTASMMAFDTNQRQSQRVAYPDFRLTPLIVKAVTTNGIAGTALSTNYNSTVVMQWYIVE